MDNEDYKELFQGIKQKLEKDYPKFKRYTELHLEIFRLQHILMSPFLKKHMFNFLTIKLLKLEEEFREIEKIRDKIGGYEGDYDLFLCDNLSEINLQYKTSFCLRCDSIFYRGFFGGCCCNNCLFQ